MKFVKLFLLSLFFSPWSSQAQLDGIEYDWKEKRNKDGIAIYTSRVEGSPFKAVRGEMIVKGSVASLFALVEDMSACSEWAAMCKESRVEKRVSDTESYVYILNDIPFPVRDRDVYTHVVWTRDAETKRVSMTSIASEGGPEKTKAVRIVKAVSQWHFTPNDDGTTTVGNYGHIDPNGPTPAWLSNLMLVNAPFKSMQKMREVIEAGKYKDAVSPFDSQ